jgi:hypothetical protein
VISESVPHPPEAERSVSFGGAAKSDDDDGYDDA